MSLTKETDRGTRLSQLKELARLLAVQLDMAIDPKSVAQMARQYRETIKEIEDIEGATDDGDEIGEILAQRKADGKSSTVRKSRARV